MLRPAEDSDRRVRVDPDGTLHLPAGCELLTHLYANHGVRVRLVRRPPPKREKIPTVRQLIDHLARKQQLRMAGDSDQASRSSASTSTVPLSCSQVLGGAGSSPHAGSGGPEVVGGGEVGGWDPRSPAENLQKLKELDLRSDPLPRPLSRTSLHRKDKVSAVTVPIIGLPVSRGQEEGKGVVSPLSGGRQPALRANGLKNNLLRAADPLLAHNAHGSAGPDEDLVAMGTLWGSSHQLQTRTASTVNASTTAATTTTTTIITSSASSSSNKSLPACIGNGNGSGGGGVLASCPGALPTRRPAGGVTTAPSWQSLHQTSSALTPAMGNVVKSNKEAEPKYGDPVPGAPPSFQQRLMELAALEAETVRWERSKKVKKKPLKQDKDS